MLNEHHGASHGEIPIPTSIFFRTTAIFFGTKVPESTGGRPEGGELGRNK